MLATSAGGAALEAHQVHTSPRSAEPCAKTASWEAEHATWHNAGLPLQLDSSTCAAAYVVDAHRPRHCIAIYFRFAYPSNNESFDAP